MLKLLLGEFSLKRERRQQNALFITNVLNDLKTVFDRADRARTVIAAHRSATTYGEEMRDLIDSRVTLRNVDRALGRNPTGKAGLTIWPEHGLFVVALTNTWGVGSRSGGFTLKMHKDAAELILE